MKKYIILGGLAFFNLCFCQQSTSIYTKSISIEKTYYNYRNELSKSVRTYFYDPSDLEEHLIIFRKDEDSTHALFVNHNKYKFIKLLKNKFNVLSTLKGKLKRGSNHYYQRNKKKEKYYLRHYKIIRFKDTIINNESHFYFGVVPNKKRKFKHQPRSHYFFKKEKDILPFVPYNHARILLNELNHDIRGRLHLGIKMIGQDTTEIIRGFNEQSIYRKIVVTQK